MVVRWGLLVAVVSSLAGCDSLTKKNPNLCCTTAEDCAAVGLPEPTGCDGNLSCVDNACTVTACEADSDCDDNAPRCAPDGVCVGCLDASDCGDQICDAETNTCRACSSNADCLDGFCSSGVCAAAIVPTYLPAACDSEVANDRVFATSESLDTGDDLDCTEIVPQLAGPEICVIRARRILIASGTELTVRGSRVIAFVADEELAVDGVVDISANGSANGPGGGLIVTGGDETSSGAGGAGFRTAGGAGGSNVDGGAANGGLAQADPATETTLRGGTITGEARLGGGAGGGATFISCRRTVSIAGLIDAGGGGGRPGRLGIGGLGGGSGGYVVLQGPAIDVTGQVFANGGGAGSGGASNGAVGIEGADALRAAAPAQGGGGAQGGGSGGSGGFGDGAPTDGARFTLTGASGGGGGGSTGFLQTYTPAGIAPNLTPTVSSPPFQPNREIETR